MQRISRRQDGRSPTSPGKTHATMASFSRADGSSEFQIENTHVQCTVYGPTYVPPHEEKLDKTTVQVTVQPLVGFGGTPQCRNWENLIQGVVEDVIVSKLHPRTRVQVIVQIVGDDGSILAAMMNAVTLALVDAGVSMKYLPIASTISIKKSNLLVDPTLEEVQESSSCHTLVYQRNSKDGKVDINGIVAFESLGSFSKQEFLQVDELARKSVVAVEGFMSELISTRINQNQTLS